MKKVAVILAGCGFLDGAEIRESVLTLLALDTQGVDYHIYALNQDQHHVVNHLTQSEASGERRNILEEAARIARGDIQDVANLQAAQFDALIMPGGFGVAKNMCSFALEGTAARVDPLILGKVHDFHAAHKPIGAICIAPALVALSLGKQGPTLTIGDNNDVALALETLGARHQVCATSDCVIDATHKIVTTPAYMDDKARLADVYAGISKLVAAVLDLC